MFVFRNEMEGFSFLWNLYPWEGESSPNRSILK